MDHLHGVILVQQTGVEGRAENNGAKLLLLRRGASSLATIATASTCKCISHMRTPKESTNSKDAFILLKFREPQ